MTTFADFSTAYLSIKEMEGVVSLERSRFALARLTAHFGTLDLADMTPGSVHIYRRARLEAGVTPATVNRECAVLSNLFAVAIEERVAEKNPVARVKPLPMYSRRDRVLTPAEMDRLLATMSHPLHSMTILGYETGMRAGEILSLRWQWIDDDDEVIRLPDGATKSRRGRLVPLHGRAWKLLSALPRTGPTVFSGWRHYNNGWVRACRRAGVEDAHFHDLRHTFVTRLRKGGIHHSVIMAITGHASPSMFLTYNSVDIQEIRAAVAT